MSKARMQMAGAILSGVHMAGSLLLGLKGIFPNWPWELHYLIGFFVFAGIMSWIIVDKQSEISALMDGRPELTIGRSEVVTQVDEETSEVKIELSFFFRNAGKKDAHRFRCDIGYAPERDVSKFRFLDEVTSVNRIVPNSDFATVAFLGGSVKYSERDGVKEVPTSRALISCIVSYSDSEHNGELYEDEWWFSYRADRAYLGVMSEEEKNLLEPHVRKAYAEHRGFKIRQFERLPERDKEVFKDV